MHFFLLVFPPIFSKFDNQPTNNRVKKGLKFCYAKIDLSDRFKKKTQY